MRRILILVSLLIVCAGAAADTRKGYDAYTSGDFKTAVEEFRKSAQQNDARAQASLAFLHYSGKGVAQNESEAAKWFRKAAEGGDAQSKYMLGYLYEDGKGVPRDAIQAHMWSNLAASQLAGEEAERVAKVRDFIASKLTPDQLAKAQELARNWQPKK